MCLRNFRKIVGAEVRKYKVLQNLAVKSFLNTKKKLTTPENTMHNIR